jgi:hypothetical protein
MQEAVDIASTFPVGCDDDKDTLLEFKFDKGFNYDWSTPTIPAPPNASECLDDTLKDQENQPFLLNKMNLDYHCAWMVPFMNLNHLKMARKTFLHIV